MWNVLRSVLQTVGNTFLTPEMLELNNKIESARNAIQDAPHDPLQLDLLGNLLGVRYSTLGKRNDLEESIQFAREAINAASAGDRGRSRYLNNLVVGLGDRYLKTGSVSDLNEAIETAEAVVNSTSTNDPAWPKYANNFAAQLNSRFSQEGSAADLEKAIKFWRKAVEVSARLQSPQEIWANNLAIALGAKFQLSGEQNDLDEAIQITRSVLDRTAADDPHRARRLNTLSNRLADRYARTRAVLDLEEAFEKAREAAALIPDNHLDRKTYLNNLALLVGDMHTRTGSLEALDTAIDIGQKILKMTPKNEPARAGRLNNLSIQLRYRYSQKKATDGSDKGALADLDESIECLREAVSLAGPKHPDRAQWLNSLGVPLGDKYKDTKDISVLQESIKITQEAVAILPKNHADRAAYLNTLGDRLADRYSETGTTEDLLAIISSYRSALYHPNSAVLHRMTGGRKVLKYHSVREDWQEAYQDARAAVELIHKLTGRALGNSDKQYMLGQIVGLGSDAAAAALNAGQEPMVALSLLEQGRSVLGTFLGEMRADLSNLQVNHPDLAKEVNRLRGILDSSGTKERPGDQEESSSSTQDVATIRSRAALDFDKLISKIRRFPDFESFLLPPSKKAIIAAGKYGPIIVINVSELRSDGLLIESSGIRCIPLPHLQPTEIEEMSEQIDRGSPAILEHLWSVVTEPIMQALGYTNPILDDNWPHIWWIPTGRLSKLPLHAAGRHSITSSETVLDRAMSSYGSSVTAIIRARQRRGTIFTSDKLPKALLVDMAVTPGYQKLKHAAKEIRIVRDLCQAASCNFVIPIRRKHDVVAHLPSCDIFHFAGHGTTDPVEPSRSALLLEDWSENPLMVADLMETNLQEHTPFLAYLSACGTGNVNDWKYLDESIHLINACQLAGYRHVVGTLWDVQDEKCLDVAKIVYREILYSGMTDKSVCLGLHKAVRQLRDEYLRGLIKTVPETRMDDRTGPNVTEERKKDTAENDRPEFMRKATAVEEGESALLWVPYVHFGV